MATESQPSGTNETQTHGSKSYAERIPKWRRVLGGSHPAQEPVDSDKSTDEYAEMKSRPEKWSMGVLNDRETEEVPGQ